MVFFRLTTLFVIFFENFGSCVSESTLRDEFLQPSRFEVLRTHLVLSEMPQSRGHNCKTKKICSRHKLLLFLFWLPSYQLPAVIFFLPEHLMFEWIMFENFKWFNWTSSAKRRVSHLGRFDFPWERFKIRQKIRFDFISDFWRLNHSDVSAFQKFCFQQTFAVFVASREPVSCTCFFVCFFLVGALCEFYSRTPDGFVARILCSRSVSPEMFCTVLIFPGNA